MSDNLVQRFEAFAAAFEAAVQDDDFERLAPFLAEDATYENIGGPDPIIEGRSAIVAFLKKDVAASDRRFDSRALVGMDGPSVEGERLQRRWQCTYTLAGAPDLVLEGEARYRFSDGLIQSIEEEVTPVSLLRVDEWMEAYGERLLDSDERVL